jgi:hypothetical protein
MPLSLVSLRGKLIMIIILKVPALLFQLVVNLQIQEVPIP